jgi:hypothetical protein
MKYYVLGYDKGNLVLMTRREFDTLSEANEYAAQCAAGWEAFVVTGVV